MKRCAHCLRDLFVECFSRCSTTRDGLQSWCRQCKARHARIAFWLLDEAARDRLRERVRVFHRTHRQTISAAARARRHANPEKTRAKDARRRRTNARAEWQRAYWIEWKKRNPERAKAISRKGENARRARIAEACVEAVEHMVVYARDRGLCGICGLPVYPRRFHVDHIIPIARGGEHSYANTQPAHPFCNISKSDRLPEEIAA